MVIRSLLVAAWSLALLPGCAPVVNEPASDAVASLDEPTFRCAIEPILARDCSYLACHGKADFAFRMYSVGKLRAGRHATLDERTIPLTSAEHHANYESAVAFTYGGVDPEENLMLLKALPAEAGGYEHLGGQIFTGLDDPRAKSLRAWLHGSKAPCSTAGGSS